MMLITLKVSKKDLKGLNVYFQVTASQNKAQKYLHKCTQDETEMSVIS